MQLNKLVFRSMIAVTCIACNSSDSSQEISAAEKRAQEISKRNPIKKGRYVCWRLSASGDQVAPELFILSDDMYQVGEEATGRYSYNHERRTIEWIDGPLHQTSGKWVGIFTPKGTQTEKGGSTLESMIQVRSQSDIDAGNKQVLIQCNCETE